MSVNKIRKRQSLTDYIHPSQVLLLPVLVHSFLSCFRLSRKSFVIVLTKDIRREKSQIMFFTFKFHWSFSLLDFEIHAKDNLIRDKGIHCLLSVFHTSANYCSAGFETAHIFPKRWNCLIAPHLCETNRGGIITMFFFLLWHFDTVFLFLEPGSATDLSHWKTWYKYFESAGPPWERLWETAS